MMKLFKSILLSVLTSVAVFAAQSDSNVTASVEGGYATHYIVNGLAKTKGDPFFGAKIGASYSLADVYAAGTVIPNGATFDESHWLMGVGKTLKLSDMFGVRVDAYGQRHQSSIQGGINSTETDVGLAITNKFITPYIRGSYDLDINQRGYFIGGERPTSVFGLFTATPTVEYGKLTDYTTLSVRLKVSRVLFGHVEPFVEVGWYDNTFSVSKYNFAVKQFKGDIEAQAGIRWNF